MLILKEAKFQKLLRVELDIIDNTVQKATITGDFFLHPEEKIIELEQSLTGCQVNNKAAIESRISKVWPTIEVAGFSKEDLVNLIAENNL